MVDIDSVTVSPHELPERSIGTNMLMISASGTVMRMLREPRAERCHDDALAQYGPERIGTLIAWVVGLFVVFVIVVMVLRGRGR